VKKAVSFEVAPKTKLMRVGESFEFQVIARDENGCRAAVNTKWELVSGSGGTLSPNGTLTVPENAPTGTLTLRASVEDKSVDVAARIVTDEEYETLIAGGEFGVMGDSLDAASITLSTAHVEFDAETAGEDEGDRSALVLLLSVLLALLGGATYLLTRKTGKKTVARTHNEAPAEAAWPLEPTPAEPVPPPEPEVRKPVRLCPVCGKRYEDDTMFCGEDGARLVRAN
jgi:hypothetical protein